MSEQETPTPQADEQVLNFIQGRTGLDFASPVDTGDDSEEESVQAVGDESERKQAVERVVQEDTEDEATEEAAPESKPESPKASKEKDEKKSDGPKSAYEAWKARAEGRGIKSQELKEKEAKLSEREEIVNTVLQTLSGFQQQQVQQHYEQNASEDDSIPAFEEDEAANLNERLRRIEERERALQDWQAQQQYAYQRQQQQSQMVQQFVSQLAQDEAEWIRDSPDYAQKSKIFFEGTVQEMMDVHGYSRPEAEARAKQAVFQLTTQAYGRGEPPMAIIEKLSERYSGATQQQAKKPAEKPKPKMQTEKAAVEDGGSLSQSRATAARKIPMSVQEFREKGMSPQQISQHVRQLWGDSKTPHANSMGRDNLFKMARELERA